MNTFMTILEILVVVYLNILLGAFLFIVIRPYLETKNKLRSMEIENDKINLFMQMNPTTAEEELVRYIDDRISEYILYNFKVYKVEYIKNDEIESMINKLDKSIPIDIPELYVFYIKMLQNVSTQDELIIFLHKKIKERAIRLIADYNSSK